MLALGLLLLQSAQCQDNFFDTYQQKIPGSALSTKMVPVKGGDYFIGSAAVEKNRGSDEGPRQKIHISPFWMGAFEVTRDEFDAFYKDETTSENVDVDAITRPSPQYVDLTWGMGKEGGYPANSMSQFAALMYCRWLYQKTGIFFRLPTEAEWEYACRAGSTTTYYFGDDSTRLDQYAWYARNSEDKYHKVGQKQPNAWGLYDMLGNLMEWTMDHYDANRYEKLTGASDPMVPANLLKYPKTLRGGGYADNAIDLRPAKRIASTPEWNRRDPQIPKSKWWLTEAMWVGFRIVRPVRQPAKEEIEKFYTSYLGR